jgi:hypothetical protein
MSEAHRVLMRDGKTLRWDGVEYEDRGAAAEAARGYEAEGFEVVTISEEGRVLLYTRRAVSGGGGDA